MFDQILNIARLFTDKTVRPHIKLITILFIIGSIYLLNNTFDFVTNYCTTSKLNQLGKISELLKDTSLTENEKLIIIQNNTV